MKESITDRNFIENLAEKISRKFNRYQEVKHLEIYGSSVKSTKISFEKGNIKQSQKKKGRGIGIRVIDLKGREGMTFTSDFSENAISLVVPNSVKMMKAATPKPYFKNIANPSKKYHKVNGIYDPELENLSLEDINKYIQIIFNLKNKPIKPKSLSGGFSCSIGATYIWNSNEIRKWERYSTVGCNIELSLDTGKGPSSGFDWQGVCNIKDLDVDKIAKRSYKMAEQGLNKSTIETGQYTILLSPNAVSQFVIDPISNAINAESVQNKMSFLGNYLKKKIGSEKLNIRDDPWIDGKLGTESFDAEGIATKPINIIENGILKNFYYNTFTAGKDGVSSNGHAARADYYTAIGISNNNLIIQPGNRSWKDLLGDIKKGVYFDYTGDSPNLVTGEFSGLLMTAYLIEDGKIGPALTETMLGINLLDAFNQIEEISKERQWVDETFVPWIKIRNATISGRS